MKKCLKICALSLVLALAFTLALLPGTSHAQEAPSLPLITGKVMRDSARITFEWPKPVEFNADASGKTLTVTFDRAANPNFGKLLSSLYPYVVSARRLGDGRTILLTMDKAYKIRTFMSDAVGGIDMLDIDPKKQQTLYDPAPQTYVNDFADTLANLAPAAGEAENKTVPVTQEPTATAAPVASLAAPPPAKGGDSVPLTPEQAAAKEAANHADDNSNLVKVNISAAEDSAVLRFPFHERVAGAVFIRGNVLWVVFNKPVQLDLADFDTLSKTVISGVIRRDAIKPGQKATALRLNLEDNVFAAVAKQQNTYEWAVLLTYKKAPPLIPLKISVNTDPPTPAHVFIPSLEVADSLEVQDPGIGDDLIITPLYNVGEGIAYKREFIDFSVLESTQGVVVSKKADRVAITTLRNGLRIGLPQGSTFSSDMPEIDDNVRAEALQGVATLFSNDAWKAELNHSRRTQIRLLFHKIVESPSVQESNEARLRLAQLYLSEGMAAEAIALLNGINRTDSAFYRSSKLAAMHGAANFLMYRYTDAARDFSAAELNNNKEMEFWRSMLTDLLGTNTPYNFLEMNPDYISKYPAVFRQRLAIVAADRSIESKQFNNAIKIFDTLHPKDSPENLLTSINSYVTFLMAKVSSETGQEKDALDAWNKLAEDYKDPFVRARAEFSRIAWGMEHGTMRKDEIITRLEKLRISWHGDALELKVLSLLGDLYADKKDYVNAMRIWDDAVNVFPSTGTAIEMSHRMEDTFVLMFTEGTVDSLPTFDALSLYYQYRKYSPSGKSGREMVGRLADRLISLDLLEQSANLLEHQMRTEAEKIQRSQLGVKIATIRLLDHQPKKALQVLEDSVYGENPVLLRLLRNRLAAESLSDLGQYEKALAILGQDDTPDAERIRLNIYWQKKDWVHVVSSVEAMLRERKDQTAAITVEESQYILQIALAYIFQNNTVQLQYLHDYFGPLMGSNPNKPVFDFLTTSDITLNPTNFDAVIKYIEDTHSFLNNYKARIKSDGIDSIIPKEKEAAAKEK